jgi:hypothetical protein
VALKEQYQINTSNNCVDLVNLDDDDDYDDEDDDDDDDDDVNINRAWKVLREYN